MIELTYIFIKSHVETYILKYLDECMEIYI